jgi:hypothetical protein
MAKSRADCNFSNSACEAFANHENAGLALFLLAIVFQLGSQVFILFSK